jgi:hypothetical protein
MFLPTTRKRRAHWSRLEWRCPPTGWVLLKNRPRNLTKSKEKKLLRSSGSCHLAPPTSKPNKRNWESISSRPDLVRERYSRSLAPSPVPCSSSAVQKVGASSTTAEQSRSEDARRAEEERQTEGKQDRIGLWKVLVSPALQMTVSTTLTLCTHQREWQTRSWFRTSGCEVVYLPLHLPDLYFLVNQRAERERGEESWWVPIPFRLS